MEKAQVNFDMATMGKAVQAFVRSRAIRLSSFIAYEENGNIIKEDPRPGQKKIAMPTLYVLGGANCVGKTTW